MAVVQRKKWKEGDLSLKRGLVSKPIISADEAFLPALRRAGSSSEFIDELPSFDDAESSSFCARTEPVPSSLDLMETLKVATTDFRVVYRRMSSTIGHAFTKVDPNFCKNGLPWEGLACRSKRAGLSGILYALPAVVALDSPFDVITWTSQACLSVLADYVYICEDSFWHGVDRYFAIFNLLTIIVRASTGLCWWIGVLALLPVGCFLGANRAKSRNNLHAWHFWHCLWHVTGGPLACLITFMLHHGAPRSAGLWST